MVGLYHLLCAQVPYTADVRVYVVAWIEGCRCVMEAKGSVPTALCEYQFQTRAVPRLEPSFGTCDELAIT